MLHMRFASQITLPLRRVFARARVICSASLHSGSTRPRGHLLGPRGHDVIARSPLCPEGIRSSENV